MWEDERAPSWRRRKLAHRLLGSVLLSLTIAAFVVLLITSSGLVLLATILLAGGTVMAEPACREQAPSDPVADRPLLAGQPGCGSGVPEISGLAVTEKAVLAAEMGDPVHRFER